jgi:predicted phosphodiesterase
VGAEGGSLLIGLIADVHGNLPALDRCLRALDRLGVERIHFLGDAVGYFPESQEVLGRLRDSGAVCQMGNHEEMLLRPGGLDPVADEIYRIGELAARIDPALLEWVRGWPRLRVVREAQRSILMVHGSPQEPLWGYVYPNTDLDPYSGLPYEAVFVANTHRPFVSSVGSRLFANVGSVGLPRDRGDLSAIVVHDTLTGSCRLLRIPMPLDEVHGRYAGRVHAAVLDCLARRPDTFVGEVVE